MEAGRGSPTLTLNLGSELNYEWEEESIPDQDPNLENNTRIENNTSDTTYDEHGANYNIPENNVFKIPRKMETERRGHDPRRINANTINQNEDRGFDYNRLGRGNRIVIISKRTF